MALFADAGEAKRIGEASTRYLYSKDAPRLIADTQPNAYVVAILRNPVDMIASLHAHKLAGGTEDLPRLEAKSSGALLSPAKVVLALTRNPALSKCKTSPSSSMGLSDRQREILV